MSPAVWTSCHSTVGGRQSFTFVASSTEHELLSPDIIIPSLVMSYWGIKCCMSLHTLSKSFLFELRFSTTTGEIQPLALQRCDMVKGHKTSIGKWVCTHTYCSTMHLTQETERLLLLKSTSLKTQL